MNSKQNPFSLYDFLGYFTPGAVFIYSCIFIFGHLNFDIQSLAGKLSFDKAEIYILFVLASYTSGHFLSYWSSLVIEKYSIWTSGYPSQYIIGAQYPKYFIGNVKVRFLVALFLLPVSLMDWALDEMIGFRKVYAKKVDLLLREVINVKIVQFLFEKSGLASPPEVSAKEVDTFRLVYHYCVENAANHLPKMQNYVALFGFLRTITLIFVLLFWATIIGHIAYNQADTHTLAYLLLGFSMISFSFYLAFVKFYRRFSLETYMALVAIYEVKKPVVPISRRVKKTEETTEVKGSEV